MTAASRVKRCECGCGQPTKPYTRSNRRLGYVKGEPARFLDGHTPKRPIPPDAPKCDRTTLTGTQCRVLSCRTPMHRGDTRRCREGHVRHAGWGICKNCCQRIRSGAQVELGPVEQPRMRPDEVLDEWEWLRGTVRWADFHEKVGLSSSGWQKLFSDAARRGDPRAVKHPKDEPVRHWRAHDVDKEKAS